jgi:hypothetical protein
MSRPGETDSGKGSFNRITKVSEYGNHYVEIDFGHPKVFYADRSYSPFDWFTEEGYYFGSDTLRPQGPYNTWILASQKMREHIK